ncbi:prepilin-type N-terminal cleavage/methylation domain-containing protein [Photobacterium carnosum]|uniref:prepilin-type N-terminal cleavage/methylation domain-containing protein n=1 Tax=Photobacterium carnosum TaxID=2023717 RepID=UPI001E58F3BB|nr:type II secretion system protein [Photobacterium carnosum]MCD9548335.1 prepilin-type N-terminal cleavage/methylation domain-containing protein [Photobacterium carnosum]MCF2305841.1 prepilin-type N-terminal cleavage/methylation domain-containing protein [Photobacterium carnosum]
MKRQQGFTLIELVVVIVILGILAVTAAPKFMNLQGDARNASLQGLKGAIQGAAGIVYGKAAIKGIEDVSGGTSTAFVGEGVNKVDTNFGYPAASTDGIANAVAGLSDTNTDWAAQSSAVNVTIGSDTLQGQVFTFKQYAEQLKAFGAVAAVTDGVISSPLTNVIPKNCYLVYVAAKENGTAQVYMPENACKD